jgi:hypothetical protein
MREKIAKNGQKTVKKPGSMFLLAILTINKVQHMGENSLKQGIVSIYHIVIKIFFINKLINTLYNHPLLL